MSWSPCRNLAMEAPFVSEGLFWCLVFDVCPTASNMWAKLGEVINRLAQERQQAGDSVLLD
jgi:hypothetical protein